jgi:hypothetical protein
VDKALGAGPMHPADATMGGLTSYGYYEEFGIMPDKCLCRPRALIGVGLELCRLPRIPYF